MPTSGFIFLLITRSSGKNRGVVGEGWGGGGAGGGGVVGGGTCG